MTDNEEENKLQDADVQQLLAIKEEVEWSSSLDQEDPPELPHIKEEQEELWISQEGEQLGGLEEADITKFTFSPVKSEEDEEEKPQSSQLHQVKTEVFRDVEHLKTEADGEDCGGPEPARNFNLNTHLQPADDDKTSHSSEPETDDSCDWEDTREPRSGLKRLQNNEVPVSDVKCNVGGKPFSCTVCGKRYPRRNSLNDHMKLHSEGKRFSCSVCKNTFQCCSCERGPCYSGQLVSAPRISTLRLTDLDRARVMEQLRAGVMQNQVAALFGVSPSTISKLKAKFHMTGDVIDRPRSGRPKKTTPQEDRFLTLSARRNRRQSSTDLQSRFAGRYGRRLSAQTIRNRLHAANLRSHRAARRPTVTAPSPSASLNDHVKLHSEGKRFSCSVCKNTFRWKAGLERHMRIHTGKKPFSCYFCGLEFTQNSSLISHMRVHTGEKPFRCSVCKARFRVSCNLSKHMRSHSGDKPFGCSVCGKRFAQRKTLRRHSSVHTGEKPFTCSVCGKTFARLENLRRHSAVHTGERPFSCSVCDKRFIRRAVMQKHKCVGESSQNK